MSQVLRQQNKKVSYPLNMLDCFKGVSMILIILSHCRNFGMATGVGNRIIDMASSGATLFFQLAAGFGIRRTQPLKMLRKTAKETLLPYLICALISIGLKFPVRLLAGESVMESLSATASLGLGFLFGTLSTQDSFLGLPIGSNGPMWFLLALFWGLQAVNLLRLRDKKKQLAAALAMTAAGYIILHFHFDYFGIARGLCTGLPIFLGYLLRKEHYIDRLPKEIAIVLAVFLFLGAFFFLPVMPRFPWLVRGAGLYFLWASQVLLMLLFSVWLCHRPGGQVTRFCRYVGRNSFLFLLIHAIGYSCMPWGGFIRIIRLADIPELGNMLCFVLWLCICAVLVHWVEKPFKRFILS